MASSSQSPPQTLCGAAAPLPQDLPGRKALLYGGGGCGASLLCDRTAQPGAAPGSPALALTTGLAASQLRKAPSKEDGATHAAPRDQASVLATLRGGGSGSKGGGWEPVWGHRPHADLNASSGGGCGVQGQLGHGRTLSESICRQTRREPPATAEEDDTGNTLGQYWEYWGGGCWPHCSSQPGTGRRTHLPFLRTQQGKGRHWRPPRQWPR